MTKANYITEKRNDLFKHWLAHSTAWGSLLFLGLAVLDYVSIPEHFRTFMIYRIAIAAVLLALSFVSMRYRKLALLFHEVLGYLAIIGSAVVIELMILKFGGSSSPYYVGMILLAVCAIGFIPGRMSFFFIGAFLIYCIYFVPLVLTMQIEDMRYFFMANMFLSFVMASLLFLKYLSEKRLQHELGLMYDLEENRKNLETTVEKRTAELSDAVRHLNDEISTRKKIDAEMSILNEQLRQSQKMEAIGLLAGGIAHDFGNILSTVKGCGFMLRKKLEKDDPLKKYAEQIISSSSQATILTESLLTLSRKQIAAPMPVEINGILRKISSLLTQIIREDIVLDVTLQEGDLTVEADRGHIEQVLLNLVTNAKDAMPRGGTLSIRTERVAIDDAFINLYGYGEKGTYALIVVSDTGMGMDKKTAERVFEPFFTTKEFGKGSGLGLAIVYGIVKQHKGHIDVDSEPGKGTTFRVYLPLLEHGAVAADVVTQSPPEGGTETVLIVEDNQDMRNIMVEILRDSGYAVMEAADGDEAVKIVRECGDAIELVLLDVIMPGKKGGEVFREIKRIRKEIKVLFMSGYEADFLDREKDGDDGINFISKTSMPEDILKKIRQVLDAR